jgi:hypothetical protein
MLLCFYWRCLPGSSNRLDALHALFDRPQLIEFGDQGFGFCNLRIGEGQAEPAADFL